MSEQPTIQASTPVEPVVETQSETGPVRWWLLPVIGGAIIALDQTAKTLVSTRLQLGQSWEFLPAISSLIKITYSQNSGAAFGMLPFASDLFLILALVTVAAFIISYPRLPSHATLSRVSIALISGGALSNALDRLRFNYVIDYVHVQLFNRLSNISNFADHAITLGVILLLIDQWRAEQRQHAEKATAEEQTPVADSGLTAPPPDDKPAID